MKSELALLEKRLAEAEEVANEVRARRGRSAGTTEVAGKGDTETRTTASPFVDAESMSDVAATSQQRTEHILVEGNPTKAAAGVVNERGTARTIRTPTRPRTRQATTRTETPKGITTSEVPKRKSSASSTPAKSQRTRGHGELLVFCRTKFL